MSTQDVLHRHLQAFGSGDLDSLIADYSEDSLLIARDKTYRGPDEIRGIFAAVLSDLFKPNTYEFALERTEIVGEVAYIVWHAEKPGARVPLGTDTYIIRNGEIVLQTFALHVDEV